MAMLIYSTMHRQVNVVYKDFRVNMRMICKSKIESVRVLHYTEFGKRNRMYGCDV